MTQEVLTVRRAVPGPLARRQKYREWATYLVLLLLLLAVIGLIGLAVHLEAKSKAMQDTLYRSNEEVIAGGRRFIDAFYSLNAATVEHDQFKAISMMVNQEDRNERVKYLVETDLVRKVRRQNLSSVIRWDTATDEVVSMENGVATVEYKAQVVLNQRNAYPLHIVLELTPVEKTDQNTDGIGVVSWTDVAKTPFIEGTNR